MYWDDRNLEDEARAQPALGPVSSVGDVWTARWNATEATDSWTAREDNLHEAFDRLVDEARKLDIDTKGLVNPIDAQNMSITTSRPEFAAPTDYMSDRVAYDDAAENIFKRIRDWKQANPDHASTGKLASSFDELDNDIKSRVQELVKTDQDLTARAGFLGSAAGFGADMASAMTDRPNFMAMLLGAPAGVGILRGAVTEAAINATVEAVQQPVVQNYRAELGLEHGWANAAERVAIAGGAAGGLYTGLRLAGRGISSLRSRFKSEVASPPAAARGAADMLDDLDELQVRNPYDADSPQSHAAYQERFDAALDAVRAGRLPIEDGPFAVRMQPRIGLDIKTSTALTNIDFARNMGVDLPDVDFKALKGELKKVINEVRQESLLPVAHKDGTPARFDSEQAASDYVKTMDRRQGEKFEVKQVGENDYQIVRRTNAEIVRRTNGEPLLYDSERGAQRYMDQVLPNVGKDPSEYRVIPHGKAGERKYGVAKGLSDDELRNLSSAPDRADWVNRADLPPDRLPTDAQEIVEAHARARYETTQPRSYEQGAPERAARAEDAKVRMESAEKLEDQVTEAALRRVEELLAERGGDMKFRVDGADGIKEVSARELLDDVADDANLLKEFEACLLGGK